MKNSFYIDDDFANSRLDRWIKRQICRIPQSLIEKSIRKGNIKINNKKQKSSYKLKKGDKVELYNFSFFNKKNINTNSRYKATKSDLSASSNIFIEDNDNFAVINKPSGIAVQSGTKSKKNILDILRYSKQFNKCTPYTVHRIDKETTGVLIIAKNRKYAQLFTSLFRIRKIHKTYLCIVVGRFTTDKGTFEDILTYKENNKKINLKAITHYKLIDSNSNYSLLKLNPETGRKHQLRKQLLIHGYPILGDSKYRLFENKKNKKNDLMLHAYKINFSIDKNKYSYLAELPMTFKNTLKEKYLKNF